MLRSTFRVLFLNTYTVSLTETEEGEEEKNFCFLWCHFLLFLAPFDFKLLAGSLTTTKQNKENQAGEFGSLSAANTLSPPLPPVPGPLQ